MASKKKKKNKSTDILDQSQKRADMVSDMMDKFEELIDNYSVQLTDSIINAFQKSLSAENGTILTSEENMRKVALIDKAWSTFNAQQGIKIITNFIDDLETLNSENLKYYRSLSDARINVQDIKNIINSRLGLDENGQPVKGGYMKGLMDDTSVRNTIKEFTFKKIVSGTGFNDLSKGLRDLVVGTDEQKGIFNQFYRNYAFDTYAHVDRLNGALYAEKLKLKYFIYQGTRRKGSRYFCLQRKGKVFSSDEAADWKDLIGKSIEIPGIRAKKKKVLIGPIVDDKATYNPTVDMGGYGCVDIASFISEEIAFSLRPDLKNKISVSEDYHTMHEGKDQAKVYVHKEADPKDLSYNIDKAKILADNGDAVKIRKHVDVKGVKNPELQFADGKLGDFKEPLKDSDLKTAVQSAIKNANAQGAQRPVIIVSNNYNKVALIRAINSSISKLRNRSVTDVWILINKQVIKITRDEIINKEYYDRLP